MRLFLFLAGLLATLTATCGPARAAESDVTPALVCRVQLALRPRSPAWPSEKCERVAAALNTTAAPRTLWGIYINESDMRDHVAVWHGPRTVDDGGFGLRCLLDDHGRCTNGVVRGYRVRDLQDAETSIRLANVLLVSLGGDVQGWNRRSRGYAARIRALVAALDGRRVEVRSARTREQVRRILNVTKKGEPRT